MVDISVGPVTSRIDDLNDIDLEELRNDVSFFVKGAQFSKAFKTRRYGKRGWDGRKHFVTYNGIFPTGLIDRVRKSLAAQDLQIELYPEYRMPVLDIQMGRPPGMEARDYQEQAVNIALHRGRGILYMPPGVGKTQVAAWIIREIDRPTLFLTHKLDLMQQTADRFKQCGLRVGTVGGGVWNVSDVTVSMIQTLYSKVKTNTRNTLLNKLLTESEVVFGDELHHLTSKSWFTIFKRVKAKWRFGLTATPQIDEVGMMLEAMTGPIIYRQTFTDAVESGWLVPIVILREELEHKGCGCGVDRLPTDFRKEHKALLHCEARNKHLVNIAKKLYDRKMQTLILVKEINHQHALVDEWGNATNNTDAFRQLALVNGRDIDPEARQCILDKFRSGRVRVLVSTVMLVGEGIDLPNVQAIILADPDASYVPTIQQVGRGSRRSSGKKQLIVYDLIDKNTIYAANRAEQRLEHYRREGFKVVKVSDKARGELNGHTSYR